MKVTADTIKTRIERMNDDVLIASYLSGSMTEDAAPLALEEIQARGLALPAAGTTHIPPAPSEYPPSDSVVAATFLTPTDAHIFKALLEAEGIPATVADANFLQAYQFLSTASGGVRVLVPEPFLQQARATFEDFNSGRLQLSNPEAPEQELVAGTARPAAIENDVTYDTADLMKSYVFQNTAYYEQHIRALLSGQRYLGFNVSAAFFGMAWLAVRKLYLLTALYGIITTLGLAALNYSATYGDLDRHDAALIAFAALLVLRLGLGFLANPIYLAKARRVSLKLQGHLGNNPDLKKQLNRMGGTSAFACALVFMASLTVNMLLRLG